MADRGEEMIAERFRRFVDGFARGEGDPDPVLAGLDDESRRRLTRMIEEFIETGPLPDPELSGPSDPRVGELVARIMPRLEGRAGALSDLLVRRRDELELSQADLVRSIGNSVEATPEEAEKIDAYYHDLEWGSLPASGLAGSLMGLLAKLLFLDEETLRAAGRSLGPGRASSSGPVYARTVKPGQASPAMASPGSPPDEPDRQATAGPGRRATPPDRIDLLFTGG